MPCCLLNWGSLILEPGVSSPLTIEARSCSNTSSASVDDFDVSLGADPTFMTILSTIVVYNENIAFKSDKNQYNC